MDMHSHRRQRLHNLINRDFGGSTAAMGRAIDFSSARMGQLLSPTFRDGQNFGEKVARKIEGLLGLDHLYLDQNTPVQLDESGAQAPDNAKPTTPSTKSAALDEHEMNIIQTYRHADPATQAAIRKILRVLNVADEALIAEQAHTFCRAVNDQVQLRLVVTPSINAAAFNELETMLLGSFRASDPRSRRLILTGGDCIEPRDDDEELDPETGCTLLELRLVKNFRDGSLPFRRTLLRLAEVETERNTTEQHQAI
jgi:hypothetical protein